MDIEQENRVAGFIGRENINAAGAQRPPGLSPFGGRPVLRIVHSNPKPPAVGFPRGVPASSQLTGKHLFKGESAAQRYAQIIDIRKTGNSWAWGGRPYTRAGVEMRCREAFHCRIWRGGTAQPVLIAALAVGSEPGPHRELGAVLAVSTLLNILEQDLSGYFEKGRLATLLRGAVGEVQLTLEHQAQQEKRPIGDYASTLLATILTDSGGVIGRIGGGSALVQDDRGIRHPIDWAQSWHTDRARWLTDANAFASFQIAALSSTPSRIRLFSGALERILTHDTSQVTGGTRL
jgi:protein phosphatase 2C-like protein